MATTEIEKKDKPWWQRSGLYTGIASIAGIALGAFGLDAAIVHDAFTLIGTGGAAVLSGAVMLWSAWKAHRVD